MRIAILMPIAEQRGGAEMLLQALMRYGQESGVHWLVVFFERGPMVEEFEGLGIETHIIPSGRLRELHRYFGSLRQLATLFREREVDLVFSWMGKAHLFGGMAARRAGLPSMWYQHGVPTSRGIMDRIQTLIPASGLLACSETAAQAQRRLWPARSTRVLHPCADLRHFDPAALPSPAEARHRLGLPAGVPIIGIVGRLQRWKGMHVLVDAMPHVLRKHPAAHCVIVGGRHALEADYEDELKAQIQRLGLADRVLLSGFQQNVPLWMQAMDVVVHASDNEPFGIVVIEAMALGKPVVAGSKGGPCEIITDGVNGLLAPYGDADSLASRIMQYLDDPEYAACVGRAARERALDFAPDRYAQQFLSAIRDAYLRGESVQFH